MSKTYDKVEENILFFALAFSVFLIFIQVVMRYVFGKSLSWSEELARYIFIWYTWIGTSLAFKNKKHIRIEILSDFLKPKAKLVLELFVVVVWAGFTAFLAYKGIEVVGILRSSGQASAALEIPMYFAYAAVPVGCTVMFLRLIGYLMEILKLMTREGA
jgi:TRAP-type C4-dicarboxylate transport system permease small subunit